MSGFAVLMTSQYAGYGQMQTSSVQNAVQNDAYALLDLIETEFAYSDRFPNGYIPVRSEMASRIPYLSTRADLVAFAQASFHTLYDHHSITGAGLQEAYGLVPSFADLWIERTPNGYEIEDVRRGSPALDYGIRPGCRLISVEGQPIEMAVNRFFGDYPIFRSDERASYAARVMATGRRDRYRRLGIECNGLTQTIELPNLYQSRLRRDKALVSLDYRMTSNRSIAIVRFNDSLGLPQTIGAFDQALSNLDGVDGIVIDLRDTASGGTSLIARGVLSRFVSQRTAYQRHILPADQRDFGVERTWLEEVSPRGPQINVPVAIVCGRWTASMGEGMTVAFDALGYPVFGSKMAGLLGGITDHKLPETGITIKLTTEKIEHVNGTPREAYVPTNLFNYSDAPGLSGEDGPMDAAVAHLATLSASGFN